MRNLEESSYKFSRSIPSLSFESKCLSFNEESKRRKEKKHSSLVRFRCRCYFVNSKRNTWENVSRKSERREKETDKSCRCPNHLQDARTMITNRGHLCIAFDSKLSNNEYHLITFGDVSLSLELEKDTHNRKGDNRQM